MRACETSVAGETARLADLVEQLGDRYEVTGKLGLGTFGEVYQAQDAILDRVVAIKRIRIDAYENEGQRDQVRKRSILEAQLAAALSHPNIVTIHDILPSTASTFIVMEYVDGKNLRDIIKEKSRLPLGDTVEILSQAAAALDFAHQRKIIHRDVKPGNIMVKTDGSVKVMDFGIAKSEASGKLTAVGTVLGTPNYMSPEQAEGLPTLDHRTDLFSLGAIAFECLSGQKAFRADSAVGILLRVVKGDTPQLDCEALGLHPDVGRVLTRALAKDPAERFATGAELMEALRKVPAAKAKSKSPGRERPAQPVITRREPGSTSSFDLDLRGTLQEKPLCSVIRDIYTTRKTGILHVKSESVARRLYFRKGSIVFANSDREGDRLGEFLIGRGEINRALFELASKRMIERGQRFGRTLVELGVMTDVRMQAAVLAQIENIIRAVFSLHSGEIGFEKMDHPVEQDIVLEISTGDTILRSIRDTVSFDIVRKELGDLSGVLRLSDNPLLRYQKISLEPSEGFVLSRVDGACSIAELVSLSPLGEEETLKCVYGLISAGVLDVDESATSRPRRRAERRTSATKPAGAVARLADGGPSESADDEAERDAEEEIATLDDIAAKHAKLASASYYELLEVDPEATTSGIKKAYYSMVKRYHPDRHHSAKLKQARGLLEELFVKISAAYEILSDESARADYDGKLVLKKIETQKSVVPEKAARAINPRFLANEHYEAARKSYDNMAYYDAIQFLQEAVRLDASESAYHKLLGMALSKNPLWREDAEESFLSAVELNPEDIDCYFRLAEIYERSGSPTRAQEMYRRVLDYDPANETALKKLPREVVPEYNLVDRLKSVLDR